MTRVKMPEPPVSTSDILVALGETSQAKVDAAADALRAKRLLAPKDQPHAPSSRPVSGYVLYVKWHTGQVREELGPTAKPADVAKELSTRWAKIPEGDRKLWNARYDDLMEQYEKDLAFYNEVKRTAAAEKASSDRVNIDHVATRIAAIEEQLSDRFRAESHNISPLELPLYSDEGLQLSHGNGQKRVVDNDYKMMFSAAAGSKILQSGKSELMKRLESYPSPPHDQLQLASPSSPVADPESPIEEHGRGEIPEDGLDEESEEEESEEEDEYPGSTEDGRGLLTDVPLILGPSEIEVLPMIVMSGIVPPPRSGLADATAEETNAIVNMHTVRCHLLLAQDNGKNLLRELLIFVAAWDLREEELYFKFMVKIMEAILVNGLMPYAYHAFREYVPTPERAVPSTDAHFIRSKSRSKDIISPAQAVIMKLLTNIFRTRAENFKSSPPPTTPGAPRYPARVDVHIVNFIFTEFRQHIIPQTCALIFLQGKIHQNLASPEDFPLNLWDMERMYEGVYQYLEFFAVLTEEQTWKDVMAQWEVASELVTMLKELEAAIPKLSPGGATHLPSPRRAVSVEPSYTAPKAPPPVPAAQSVTQPHSPVENVVSVERPFDLSPLPQPAPALPPLPPTIADPVAPPNTIFEAETPLAYPEDPQDEPSDFEWRNLKKLTVLVLSSLIWKNKKVQDQVREYGGLQALVGCCRHDEHNPYIREHAIMCLRFAVEGNSENAEVIRAMAGLTAQRQAHHAAATGGAMTLHSGSGVHPHHMMEGEVPREVLDTNGYETFMDGKGQVGLRRKDGSMTNQGIAHGAPLPSSSSAVHHNQGQHHQQQAYTVNYNAAGGSGGHPATVSPKVPKMNTKMAAEKAAEIMQTALRDLPLPAGMDRDNKEIIARLNRTALEMGEEVAGASNPSSNPSGAGPSAQGRQ